MGRDLRSQSGKAGKPAGTPPEDANAPDAAQKAAVEDKIKQYSSMSETELMQSLFATAKKGREGGGLSNTELDAFLLQVSPMLSEEQRGRMENLITLLKVAD